MEEVIIASLEPARVAAPDGSRLNESLPVLVLPEGTQVRGLSLHFLACGGMSVAYRGKRSDGRVYFVKEVPNEQTQAVMALSQEKALLERLRHPGIVRVHELFEWGNHQYLVQDFVEGGSLEQQLSPFPDIFLSQAVVKDWALQLCDIFEYLHGQEPPIIYRDLKPKNVLRSPNGKLFLVDFGIARAFKEGKEQDTRLLGSVLTASPEHYGGQTDTRSDLYTLGATLHYLLTNGRGERVSPFDFPSIRSLNPQVDAEFESVIGRCLLRSPEQRYQSVGELRRALVGGAPTPIPPAPTPAAPREIPPARPMWPVLLVGLTLGVGLTLWIRPQPVPQPGSQPSTQATVRPPIAVVLPPRPEVTATPRRLTASPPPRPTPSAVVAVVPPPAPRPQPVATPEPVVVEPPPVPAPAPAYPVARPSSPTPSSQVRELDDPRQLLRELGLPWVGIDRLRSLKASDLHEQDWALGPQGLFRFPVPDGYGYFGEANDFLLAHLDGLDTRLLRFRTLPGKYCDPDKLFELRRQQLGGQLQSTRTFSMGGRNVSAVVFQLPRRRSQLEEVFWSHSNQDWTLVVAGAASARHFPEFQASFESWLGQWQP